MRRLAPRTPAVRAALLAGVLLALGWAAFFVPVLASSEQPIAATVTPPPLASFAPITLAPGARACTDRVPLSPDTEVAEIRVDPGDGRPGPPLRLSTGGPGFTGTPTRTAPYRGESVIRTPISVPRRSLLGRLCVANAGTAAVDLQGTVEPRTQTVSQTTVDGAGTPVDLQLALYEAGERTLVSRLPDVLDRMATFKGAFVAPWVLWILAVAAFIGVPAGIVMTIGLALREDAALLAAGAAQPEDRDEKAREEDLDADDDERRGEHR